MPTGLGDSPMGTSILGYGTNDQAPAPVTTILVDSATGLVREARKIDPATGQYVYTNGAVDGMSGVKQLVTLRMQTLLNSSVMQDFGIAPPGGVIDRNYTRQLTDAVNNALKDLVNAGLITVLSVQVVHVPGTDSVRRYVLWRDLTSSSGDNGQERTDF